MTHVFVVDQFTFKYHLEFLFAGIGAKDKTSPFLTNSTIPFNHTTERMLVGMLADISRIRIGDKVVFYLQASAGSSGLFFGVFKVASLPFFDENDDANYLKDLLSRGLSLRILLEPDEVYSKGITEHEYLDSLQGKSHPYELVWSLIYRKLKGNRGCTMIMDYEFQDLLRKFRLKNNNKYLQGESFTFNTTSSEIELNGFFRRYSGRSEAINILPRLLFKSSNRLAFETHLQAYITQSFDSEKLANLLIPVKNIPCWIGNEVSCGVGMQRIDIMLKQEIDNEIFIRLIELKDEEPQVDVIETQLPWYLEWLSYYVLPNYKGKKINVIPTIIGKGPLTETMVKKFENFNYTINNVNVSSVEYIGFSINKFDINFNKYL
jgi:hypothetical protein